MFQETEMSFWHHFVPNKEFSITINQCASPTDPKPWLRPYSLQAVKLHGGIDILVSNAAVNPFFGNLLDVTEEVWDKVRGDKAQGAGLREQHKLRLLLPYICQVRCKCKESLVFAPGVHLGRAGGERLPLSLPISFIAASPSLDLFHLLLLSYLLPCTPAFTVPLSSCFFLVYFQQTWQLICQKLIHGNLRTTCPLD